MKKSHLVRKIGVIIAGAIMCVALMGSGYVWAESSEGATGESPVKIEPEKENQCASILKDWCNEADEPGKGQDTIQDMIVFAISILSIGIGVLATIGIIVCGYLIMTARDNEAQMQKAKTRLLEIVIGVVLWALGALLLLLIIPDNEAAEHVHDSAVIQMREIK